MTFEKYSRATLNVPIVLKDTPSNFAYKMLKKSPLVRNKKMTLFQRNHAEMFDEILLW